MFSTAVRIAILLGIIFSSSIFLLALAKIIYVSIKSFNFNQESFLMILILSLIIGVISFIYGTVFTGYSLFKYLKKSKFNDFETIFGSFIDYSVTIIILLSSLTLIIYEPLSFNNNNINKNSFYIIIVLICLIFFISIIYLLSLTSINIYRYFNQKIYKP